MKHSNQLNTYSNCRISERKSTSAVYGKVVVSPVKSVWFIFMFIVATVAGFYTFSFDSLLVFLLFTAITLCLGHSLGMHRRLIHKSFECPKWLEYIFVHLGVLVGLAGPKGMMETHDMRDWAQRQDKCHDYFGHKQPILIDGIWQLLCDMKLENPPGFIPEKEFSQDKIYQWMEKTWMWQQLPWAIFLFIFGGISWVVWGICVRVVVSTMGHWLIGYFAHNKGERVWHVKGASAQGYNIKFAALITMGESWHNNHQAFPGSAQLGIEKNQIDPGWWVLKFLEKMGLVWDLKLPEDLPARDELENLNENDECRGSRILLDDREHYR